MLQGLLPSWVEPDPLRSRATDALGFQAVADRLADRLLPGLSVLTTRARYFTFLAWARNETGREHDERTIHRYEIALVFAEASLSEDNPDHSETCQFVGSRNIRSIDRVRMPRDPRQVYKVPAWRAYRASMIALGLVEGAPRFSITDLGQDAGKAFARAVRHRKGPNKPLPESACLTRISGMEIRLMKEWLGLSLRGPLDLDSLNPAVRRAAFVREVRDSLWHPEFGPETVLPRYENRKSLSLTEPAQTLRTAAIWEYLSVGLNTLFVLWVRAIDAGRRKSVEQNVARILRRRVLPTPRLETVDLTDEAPAIERGIACIRYALQLHNLLSERGVHLPAADTFDLASRFLKSKHALDGLQLLLQTHRAIKGDEAWVAEGSPGNFEIVREAGASWKIPAATRPHGYRMSAFRQMVRDLGA